MAEESTSGRGRIVVACLVWLVIIGLFATGYKFWYAPSKQKAKDDEQAQQDRKQAQQQANVINQTSSRSRYDIEINFGIDSFSGYAVFRSSKFEEELSGRRIRLNLVDDGANYAERYQSLKDGKTQMAVFTVDAFIKVAGSGGTPPATIIAMVDETRGADAMVAYNSAIPNVDALNSANVRFVLTPDSPSETLTRVVMSNFHLTNLDKNPFVKAADAKAVYEAYRKANPTQPQVFVLWEPYVSKVLDNPNCHVVLDSSKFRGYIVDVIVVSRDFLLKNQSKVQEFVECYYRAMNFYRTDMMALVIDDGKKTDTPLSTKQAQRLVDGIWWKNVSENYSHFGVGQNTSLQHVEDIISNLTKVLVNTGAIKSDPTGGRPNLLYYDGVLRKMAEGNFIAGMVPDKIREDKMVLAALTDKQWEQLVPVGTLDVQPLSFARGTASLTDTSMAILDDLILKLKAFPSYYLSVKGNASTEGDIIANTELAKARARAAQDYLIQKGVDANRIKAIGGEPSGESSVTFVFGQMQY